MFKLQSDIGKCENEQCAFNNETEISFSKICLNLIKKECGLHNLSQKGSKFILITSLVDHYSTNIHLKTLGKQLTRWLSCSQRTY